MNFNKLRIIDNIYDRYYNSLYTKYIELDNSS